MYFNYMEKCQGFCYLFDLFTYNNSAFTIYNKKDLYTIMVFFFCCGWFYLQGKVQPMLTETKFTNKLFFFSNNENMYHINKFLFISSVLVKTVQLPNWSWRLGGLLQESEILEKKKKGKQMKTSSQNYSKPF